MPTKKQPPTTSFRVHDCTIYLGDSVAMLKAGAFGKIGAIVSNPPYGINFQHSGGGSGGIKNKDGIRIPCKTCKIIGDDVDFEPGIWIDAAPVEKSTSQAGPSSRILLWGADHFKTKLPKGGTLLAWDKHLGRGADDTFTDCEWAWCGRNVKREVFRWLWKGLICQKIHYDFTPPPRPAHPALCLTRSDASTSARNRLS